jgi:Protein of unknown function (DUF3579)
MNSQHAENTSNKNMQHIIIEGLTREGKPFRPSDWVDRTCSTYARFGTDKKLIYSPFLKPIVKNGTRSLEVNLQLKTNNPEGFEQLIQFANENNLNILDASGTAIDVDI